MIAESNDEERRQERLKLIIEESIKLEKKIKDALAEANLLLYTHLPNERAQMSANVDLNNSSMSFLSNQTRSASARLTRSSVQVQARRRLISTPKSFL